MAKRKIYYAVTYTDPADEFAKRTKTWGAKTKKKALSIAKDLAVVWGVPVKSIPIKKTSKKYPSYF